MKEAKEEYLKRLIKEFGVAFAAKFRAGDLKHGDDFFKLTPEELIDEAIQESLDQYSYLTRLRELIHYLSTGGSGNDMVE